ncbi:MAG: DinB family protein [Chloroflexi bacterium]|nr:DinB family protein [Chloroflexota bacterium]
MPITLLFDLDETLLDTNLNAFVQTYFQKLAERLAPHVPPETLLKYLMLGTRNMMASEDPAHTLREVFDESFYPFFNVDREAIAPAIEDFYDNVFPSIREVTQPIPGAVEFIEWAFAAGHRVVIATSPYFPRKATYHRLRWAGLPPEKYPFALISTYDDFHFTKPHVAYFAEVLARLGWPDGPVLMVGNDVEQDLIPAAALGLATYHSVDVTPSANGFNATGRGRLAELRAWLEQTDHAALMPSYSSSAALLAILRSTPAALTSLLAPLAAEKLAARPSADEWSVTEILCHMRDVEREVDQPRIQKILSEDEPFIPAELPDEWAKTRAYDRQDGLSALREFTAARVQTLEALAQVAPAQWSRKARHAIFGPTTLQELVSFNAEHDRLHIQQVWKSISS